jgi:hypothetical protein
MDVKYLSENEIERQAAYLLAEFNIPRGLRLVAPIPVEDLLERHLKLRLDFDDLHSRLGVPRSGEEPEVLGALWAESREIFIDQSLDPVDNPEMEGRYRFTLGHEIGHWQLHREYLAPASKGPDLFGHSSQAPTVICRASQAKERVEWQADCFASCLLMPRSSAAPLVARGVLSINPSHFHNVSKLGLGEASHRLDRVHKHTCASPRPGRSAGGVVLFLPSE